MERYFLEDEGLQNTNSIFLLKYLYKPKFVLNLHLLGEKIFFGFGGRKPKFFLELAHGVTGNTSVFGTEESRFEP